MQAIFLKKLLVDFFFLKNFNKPIYDLKTVPMPHPLTNLGLIFLLASKRVYKIYTIFYSFWKEQTVVL